LTLKISIYGLGNFGYALLKHLDNKNNHKIEIFAYDRNEILMKYLKKYRRHLFLHKSIKISQKICLTNDIGTLLEDCDVLIMAINSESTRDVIKKIKKFLNKKIIIVNTAKAIDYKTGNRLSELFYEQIPKRKFSYSILAGGTIAKDLFHHEPLGADIACKNKNDLKILKNLFEAPNLKIYTTTDLTGVEYASAFKNIIAIMAGIINGMNFSFGSETHVISRSAYEIQKIILKRGGKMSTFKTNSQSWTNDLWMSCMGNSRNREFGKLLGKGLKVNQAILIMKNQRKTVEGINTLKGINESKISKEYPLLNFLYRLIIKKSTNIDELKTMIVSNQNKL
jgi:glycerol-3-phosphate dehydrogenase (NAD(P)+)